MPVANEGWDYLLDASLRQAAQEAIVYLGLCNDTLVATDGLTDIVGEPVGNGYARIALNCDGTDWPTLQISTPPPGWEIKSKLVFWTASGGPIPAAGTVNTMFLASTSDNSGILVAWDLLDVVRQVLDGDSLEGQFRIKLI